MNEIVLNDEIIEKVKKETTEMVKAVMGKDLVKVVLYGSRSEERRVGKEC